MKKYIIFSLLIFNLGFGQNPEIKTELPSVIPPSPTVSALMKFEEVPVSNYTGIPDISIPLYSMPTNSKDVVLNLALKYHPASVAANEVASDVGLGWSLFPGGTISRTVRGLPDEILDYNYQSGNSRERVGLYHVNNHPQHLNYYYYFNDNLTNPQKDYYVTGPISAQEYEQTNKFIWESKELGKYDTEHDLWQFNFMGYSGRFYIKLNQNNSSLEVIPLDDYRLKIEYNYQTQGIYNNPYIPLGFTIYDEKGNKYIFDILEKSYFKSVVENYYGGESFTQSADFDKENISAIHLSKVYDPNNKLIFEINYSNEGEYSECSVLSYIDYNEPYSYPLYISYSSTNNCNNEILPFKSNVKNFIFNKVRKVKEILINNVGQIKLYYNFNREDSNIAISENSFAISKMEIVDLDNSPIKSWNFEYDYSIINDDYYNNINYKRLLLKKVIETEGVLNNQKYEFEYYDQVFSGQSVGIDYWGYFNIMPSCVVDNHMRKSPSPEFSTRDLLRKLVYPSGGCALFDFEANSYSFQGDDEIQDFFQDDQNIELVNNTFETFNNNNNSFYLGILSNNYKKIIFGPSIVVNDLSNATRTFLLKKKVNSSWVQVGRVLHCQTENCCIEFYPEQGVEYKIDYANLDIEYSGNESLSINYYSVIQTPKNYLLGGGNRIKKIGYFDKNVDKRYFEINSSEQLPSKLINFDYSYNNDINKSSGSLVYVKPHFIFDRSITLNTECRPRVYFAGTIDYKSFSSQNIFKGIKTHGAEVGYKQVKVSEINNGSSEYFYTSPIDFPEEIESNSFFEHVPSKNIDYKRGQILKEIKRDASNKVLEETDFQYDYENYDQQTGIKFLKSRFDINYQGSPLFNNFGQLKHDFENNLDIQDCYYTHNSEGVIITICYTKSRINFHNGNPINQRNIFIRPVIEAYGWAKLKDRTTKNYFYPNGSSTPNIVESVETYAYNSINKKISESTVSNSRGETLTTKYFYHNGNSIHSQNRISEIERIETYRASELLSKSQVVYNNNWTNNVSFLPQIIQTAKGSEGYENRLHYLHYDEFGNPLEVKQEEGIHICYIWGYNKTQPVAKLENIAYGSIPSSHIQAIETASNSNNEASLITALNALRNDAALSNVMITTYTYKPLVGISTVTDPKGDKQTYHYDSFNRLEFVKDAQGNILSENQYHYRTQN